MFLAKENVMKRILKSFDKRRDAMAVRSTFHDIRRETRAKIIGLQVQSFEELWCNLLK